MSSDLSELAEQAVELTRQLLGSAEGLKTRHDRQQAELMAEMLDRPANLAFTLQLADQVFRPKSPKRVAGLLSRLVDRHGLPTFLSSAERAAFSFGVAVSRRAARLTVPAIRSQVRSQSADLILDAEDGPLTRYLARAGHHGFSVNVNLLGEAVLGDREAENRMQQNTSVVRRSDVTHMSVKISSVVGRLRPIAFEASVEVISEQLRRLYREANRQSPAVFINLDMEAYEDLDLTLAAFHQVLNEDEFMATRAGIVLQAYLPDSHRAQEELTQWAVERRGRGGAPIRVRLVKGANLGMERVTAELNGWTQAPYDSKQESDASFKRMVLYGLDAGRTEAVRLGIASHNLFDVAFARVAAEAAGVRDGVEYEMLQGMAPHQARAVKAATNQMLLYAPIVDDESFVSAVAYLARRLEENTDPDNYLRHIFAIGPSGDVFETEARKFRESVEAIPGIEGRRGRRPLTVGEGRFNAANTDFTNPELRSAVSDTLDRWRTKTIPVVPLVVAGRELESSDIEIGRDPSRPQDVAYRYFVATDEDLTEALAAAATAQPAWARLPPADRRGLLQEAAKRLEAARFDLIGCMVLDGGKRVVEADVEVSEAVDMATYYARAFDDLGASDCRFDPLGVVAVAPPWNFPVAIPAGGVLAALMAGNSVILKPAPQAVLCSWTLVNVLWAAGIPRDVLQFLPTRDDEVGRRLMESADGVILTGAWDTGRLFTSWKPDMRLFAETSGKNAFIITATADLDQAIGDLVDSAFGHAGQKCSAASLALVEAEIHDSAEFSRQLADAVESLTVGSAWDVGNDVTSLIGPPHQDLQRGLTELDPGEKWLVQPRPHEDHGWSPGVRLGVLPGSFFHGTECFGPVLGVVRVDSLDEAIDVANSSDFGLTSGLHSLDEDEIDRWADRIEAGNAYINRTTTGAVVRRQPFGGWKKSVFGPGAKAGGPNYVISLGTWRQEEMSASETVADPTVDALVDAHGSGLAAEGLAKLRQAAASFVDAWDSHYAIDHDPSGLRSESNVFRYRPVPGVIVRLAETRPAYEVAVARLAAAVTGQHATVSVSEEVADPIPGATVEATARFAERLADSQYARVRFLGTPDEIEWRAARESHSHLADDPVVLDGRLELRHYLREQSVARTRHRHGMLPPVP